MENNINLENKYIEFIAKTIQSVFADVEIYIFGSRVQGKSYKYSDVDIAIKGEKKLDITKIITLKSKFHDSDFPYKIDIIDLNTIDNKFKNIIQKGMIQIDL